MIALRLFSQAASGICFHLATLVPIGARISRQMVETSNQITISQCASSIIIRSSKQFVLSGKYLLRRIYYNNTARVRFGFPFVGVQQARLFIKRPTGVTFDVPDVTKFVT